MTPLVLIGDCWGEAEAGLGRPFVGSAGQELYRLLVDAGFPLERLRNNYVSPHSMSMIWRRSGIPLLNVFNSQPENNNVELLYGGRGDDIDESLPRRRFKSSYRWVRAEHSADVRKLHDDLRKLRPNLICALGGTACWALDLGDSIGKLRGFVHPHELGKVLPTYHPSAVLRNWSLRIPTLFDLFKARREAEFSDIRLMDREIWTEPTIADLWQWWETYGKHSKLLALDIETLKGVQVTEIGFASDATHALHVPFCWKEGRTYKQWWPDTKTETEAWKFVKHVCESPVPKIGQNGVQYDCFMLAKCMNIVVNNYQHDTMQAAHAWMPEMGKGLRDLGAIFLDEISWKSIRSDTNKEGKAYD
jgi:uracil-DNA glycosylase